MKYIRISALVLAGALTLSLLTACGGKDAEATPAPEDMESPAVTESLPPEETPAESGEPDPSETADTAGPGESGDEAPAPESQSPAPSPKPTASAKPSAKPSEKPPIQTPAQKPADSAKPSESPAASQPPADTDKVQASWDAISGAMELPAFMDLDDDLLSELYGISTSDLVTYVGKIPMMNVQATEFFIAQVQPGKMDTVKTGIARRQADLQAQWEQYLPAQLELVKNYKLVTNGDYVMFCICRDTDTAVSQFNSCTK
ncbi:MAG: DUF4358 domain-containing protein [Clostridiales bacterium]|nr:DUF4358 domain-containing protein [Clostridiales bacterium]